MAALSASSSALLRNGVALPRLDRSATPRPRGSATTTRAFLPGQPRPHFRAPKFARDLGEWSTGADVQDLQRALGTYRQDGIYGGETIAAVKLWQRANDISPTGYFGPVSRAKWAKTNGGVRPAWISTAPAVVVEPPRAAPRPGAPRAFDPVGPALLGAFVIAACASAKTKHAEDPTFVEDLANAVKTRAIGAWATAKAAAREIREGVPAFVPEGPGSSSATVADAMAADEGAETKAWSLWGGGPVEPGFEPGFEPGYFGSGAKSKKTTSALLNFSAARTAARGDAAGRASVDDFDTLDSAGFVRPSEYDVEERRARLEELDKKFRERREARFAALGGEEKAAEWAANAPPPPPAAPPPPAPVDVSAPVVGEANETAGKATTMPRTLPKVVPASSPSAMAAYERMVKELEAAEAGEGTDMLGPR